VTRTLSELLEVVEQLRPIIEANAPLAEAERRLPAEVSYQHLSGRTNGQR